MSGAPAFGRLLAQALGVEIVGLTEVGGGDVARSFRVRTADGRVLFAKTHPSPPARTFTGEAAGLEWLRAAAAVPVPEVVAVADEPVGHLVLSWIEQGGRSTPDGEARFGARLARLHRAGAPAFGRTDGVSHGSQALPNGPRPDWVTFYARDRLVPLAELARARRALPDDDCLALHRLAAALPGLGVPQEPPARLHGDLWAGNRVVDAAGDSWVVDPSAHGGHREYDLAMMRLFGGFGEGVFAAYDSEFPLAPGAEDRVALHQVVPLVVHAVKFGGGYVSAAARAVRRYL